MSLTSQFDDGPTKSPHCQVSQCKMAPLIGTIAVSAVVRCDVWAALRELGAAVSPAQRFAEGPAQHHPTHAVARAPHGVALLQTWGEAGDTVNCRGKMCRGWDGTQSLKL